MSKLSGFVIFAAGAAIGAVSAWQYTKRKYEKIANDEIESVKEVFSKRNDAPKNNKTSENTKETSSINNFTNVVKRERYSNYGERKEETPTRSYPYVITPDDFGEFDEYEKISLTYYSDKVLVDGEDEIIDNVEELIGPDALESFGEYEDDSVFVRDDIHKRDFEILLDNREFSDVMKSKPRSVNDE